MSGSDNFLCKTSALTTRSNASMDLQEATILSCKVFSGPNLTCLQWSAGEAHLSFCRLITAGCVTTPHIPSQPFTSEVLSRQLLFLASVWRVQTQTGYSSPSLISPSLRFALTSEHLDNIQVQYKHRHPSLGRRTAAVVFFAAHAARYALCYLNFVWMVFVKRRVRLKSVQIFFHYFYFYKPALREEHSQREFAQCCDRTDLIFSRRQRFLFFFPFASDWCHPRIQLWKLRLQKPSNKGPICRPLAKVHAPLLSKLRMRGSCSGYVRVF